MQTPPRASTSRRLLAAMGAMLLLLLASVTQSMLREGQLIDTLAQVASEDLERIALLSEINDDANEASRRLVVLLVAGREQRVHAYEEIDTANRHLDSAMLLLARHIEGGERNPQFLDLTNLLQRYRGSIRPPPSWSSLARLRPHGPRWSTKPMSRCRC